MRKGQILKVQLVLVGCLAYLATKFAGRLSLDFRDFISNGFRFW